MPKKSERPKKNRPKQSKVGRDAVFFAYVGIGSGRSLERLAQVVGIPIPTLRVWSVKDKWQDRLKEIEGGIVAEMERSEIERLTPTIRILNLLRRTAINNSLAKLSGQGEKAKVLDNKLAWEMARTELGLPSKVTKQTTTMPRVLTTDDLEQAARNGVMPDPNIIEEPEDEEDEPSE